MRKRRRKVVCSSCGMKGMGAFFKEVETKRGDTKVVLCPRCYEVWKSRRLLKS